MAAMRQTDGGPAGLTADVDPRRLATGLGWFSLALGAALTLAPRAMVRAVGVRDRGAVPVLARLVGVREIAAGLGIVSQPRPAGWMWSRLAGDVMDLTLLGAALLSPRTTKGRLGVGTAVVLGVTALDAIGARELTRMDAFGRRPTEHALAVRKAVTVNRSAEQLYRFWRDFSHLPTFMRRLESVRVLDDQRSHWRARGPAGTLLEWDSQVVDDRPNDRIAWRSLPGSRIDHAGVVRFERAPGGRGTQVTVELEYTPPAGVLTATIAKIVGQAPEQQLAEDLRRFKQLMETGEIAVAGGAPDGIAAAAQASAGRRVAAVAQGGRR